MTKERNDVFSMSDKKLREDGLEALLVLSWA